MYSEIVMDHFIHPRNVGKIEEADGMGEAGSPVCGDIMKIYMKVEEDIIQQISFQTFGCAAAIATSSMATQMIKGKKIQEALLLTNQAVVEALGGLPEVKLHCSVLAKQAIKNAIIDYYQKQGKDTSDLEEEKIECHCQGCSWKDPDELS